MRQVCFAIVGKTKMHMSEMCVGEDAECLSDELAMAKEDFPEEDFQIVPLFTRRILTSRAVDGACTCGLSNDSFHPNTWHKKGCPMRQSRH
jgi:hypothetical protein